MQLRGTTLAAPCLWAALSATCLAIGTLIDSQVDGMTLSAERFAVAATTLCPMMAVLGAKRPQDRGWQWVVATLWLVLVWPAAQAIVLPAGVRLELFVAWKLFLWGLIGLGLLNYLPTAHWRSAILVALGQILLLREHLWLPTTDNQQLSQLVAILSFLSAAMLGANRPVVSAANDSPLSTLTAAWHNFRNQFGAFWALRVLGRINQSSQQRNWPVQLHWSGFATTGDQQPNDDQLAELEQTMDSMLRRFVVESDATTDDPVAAR